MERYSEKLSDSGEVITDEILQDKLNFLKIELAGWYESQGTITPDDVQEHVERDRHWDEWTEDFAKMVRKGYETSRYGVELLLGPGLSRGRQVKNDSGRMMLYNRVFVKGPTEIELDYIEKHQTPQDAVGERPVAAQFSDNWQFYTGSRELGVVFSLLQVGQMLATGQGDLKLRT